MPCPCRQGRREGRGRRGELEKHKHERERRQDSSTKVWRGPQAKVKLPIHSWLASMEKARCNPSQHRQQPPRCYPACVPMNVAGLLSEELHLLPFHSPSVFPDLLVSPLLKESKADPAAKKQQLGYVPLQLPTCKERCWCPRCMDIGGNSCRHIQPALYRQVGNEKCS